MTLQYPQLLTIIGKTVVAVAEPSRLEGCILTFNDGSKLEVEYYAFEGSITVIPWPDAEVEP